MATAWTALANTTLASAVNSVTFSSISGSYRDLVLVMQYGVSSAGASIVAQINDDTGANYNFVSSYGNGSSAASAQSTSQNYAWLDYYGTSTSSTNATIILHLMDYAKTDKHKTLMARHNDSSVVTEMNINRWANTSAITKIKIYVNGGTATMPIGSTFALYGVSA